METFNSNIVHYVIKGVKRQTLGVNATINDRCGDYSLQYLLMQNIKFSNAVVCKNGTIRGKGCNLGVQYVSDRRTWVNTPHNRSSKIIRVYHGSPYETFTSTYGLGEDKHDYGRGFYLTEHKELACEWAKVSEGTGYLHTYGLDLYGLKIFNYNNAGVIAWLAELMYHRDADNSARYKRLSKKFIDMYKTDTSGYDIIYGWRADSSYFNIAKRFVRNEIDTNMIEKLFKLGDLENQFCIKSKLAFSRLKETGKAEVVDESYRAKYKQRDSRAREEMMKLIESSKNTMKYGFDYCIEKKRSI